MRTGVKILIAVVVIAAVGSFAVIEHRRADRAEAEAAALHEATTTMAEVNTARPAFNDAFKIATLHVAEAGIISVARAGKVVTDEALPVIDKYLAQLDRALFASAAYLAFHPQLAASTHASLDTLTASSKALHAFRDKLAELADKAAKGQLSLDDLTGQLTAMSLQLLSGS